MHTMHTCRLSEAKATKDIHTSKVRNNPKKVQQYIAVRCGNIHIGGGGGGGVRDGALRRTGREHRSILQTAPDDLVATPERILSQH